jgi:hypothetical protein
MTPDEKRRLLRFVSDSIRLIRDGSGFGTVRIEVVAGRPRELSVERSLRFDRDLGEEET